MNKLFDVLLDSVCQYFIEHFCIDIHQGYVKTHPCLIEDWGEIIGEKFDICHPEYDLLSVFTLFQEEE